MKKIKVVMFEIQTTIAKGESVEKVYEIYKKIVDKSNGTLRLSSIEEVKNG